MPAFRQLDSDSPAVAGGFRVTLRVCRRPHSLRRSTKGGATARPGSVRTAEQKEALARYASQALRAIGDVEKALAGPRMLAVERVRLLAQVLAEHERTLQSTRRRNRIGRQDQRAVQRSRCKWEVGTHGLLRVQSEQLIQRVNLHWRWRSFAEPVAWRQRNHSSLRGDISWLTARRRGRPTGCRGSGRTAVQQGIRQGAEEAARGAVSSSNGFVHKGLKVCNRLTRDATAPGRRAATIKGDHRASESRGCSA